MNDDANEARQALSVLRDRPVSVDAERLAARRARVIASISSEVSALGASRRKRRFQRAAAAALGLAAAASALLGVRHFATRPTPPVATASITFVGSVGETRARTGDASRALRAGEALARDPGQLETTAAGSAELVTPAGLGLRLGSATQLSLAALLGPSNKNQVELQQGELTCTVPHLQEGQRFSVQTPDARVVVHGTVFSVRVDRARAAGKATCVEVTEGVVIVQHQDSETALNAGDRWGCEADANALAPVSSNDAPLPGAPPIKPAPAPHPTERGTLARESELFQRALTAERLGQRQQATTLLEQLLAKYPSSPLAPEARRALSRVASAR